MDSTIQLSTIYGHEIRLPRDLIPYQQTMLERFGVYEPETSEAIYRFVKPGMHVVECGACCGYHAMNLAKAVGATGKVYCFEANPDLIPILSTNLEMNGYLGIAEVINKGVWESDGQLPFPVLRHGLGTASLKATNSNPEVELSRLRTSKENTQRLVTLDVVSLDRFFAGKKLDFLRMDIEGAEIEALKGATAILRDQDVSIIMEWTPENGRKDESDWIYENLTSLGFRLYRLLTSGPERIETRDDFHEKHAAECRDGQRDVFCSKREI